MATIGSCFAQHLGSNIAKAGFDYFVAESCPGELPPAEARSRKFGIFSARYGNVYTVRQALQLFDRAYARFQPAEHIWRRGPAFIDAFRPQIEPAGFATAGELLGSRSLHLASTRRVFEECHWLILTLGLTEGWRVDPRRRSISTGTRRRRRRVQCRRLRVRQFHGAQSQRGPRRPDRTARSCAAAACWRIWF